MDHLTWEDLKKMILFSCERIERDKDQINKINVFPVPDQDTGNNMAATLNGIKKAVNGKDFKSIEDFSLAVLDGALTCAQGNAGIIYTGFLAGFLSDFKEEKADIKKIAFLFEKGFFRAKQSIQNPKAGTILDVIEAASAVFKEESEKEKNLAVVFKKSAISAQKALIATREKMPILKKANVVDAGGLGFLMILESYVDALNSNGDLRIKQEERESSEKVKKIIQIISNRYEIVSLIENPVMEEKEIRDNLKSFGNCLDIVKIKNRLKIHIHTDFPEEVKSIIRKIGQIQDLRMEDMAKEVVGEESVKKISIGIVTDELADLTQKITERYKIETVPFKVVWREGEKLKGKNLYQKMEEAEKIGIKNLPKTSQPSPKEISEAYKKQLQKFEEVLYISFSSKLSGGYNSACQAKAFMENDSILVFDSMNATAGQALLVLRAIELIQSQTELSDIAEELKKESLKIKLCGIPADPRWLEWGGRISKNQAKIIRFLKKLRLMPMLGIKEGKIENIGFHFGTKDISEAIFKEIESKTKKSRKEGKKIRAIITHCDNAAGADKLKSKLKDIKIEVSFVNLVGSTIGAHVGPGTLIAAWTEIE